MGSGPTAQPEKSPRDPPRGPQLALQNAMNTSKAVSATLLVLLTSCATRSPEGNNAHELELELRQLQTTQRVFREQNTVPQVFNFPGHGRVTVREITLDGFPGNEYLRCRFHYENRTDKPVVQSWVMLDILNPAGQLVASQATVCIIPHPMAIKRGSFVMDELRALTRGAHLEPGWSWRIRCVAEQQQPVEPLDPPIEQDRWPVFPPIKIKNRGQNDWIGGGSGYNRDGNGNRVPGGRDR